MDKRDALVEVYRTQQEKYNYYVIAVAVACVGFSVNLTLKHKLVLLDISLGIAILLWLISIYTGFRLIRFLLSSIFANVNLLDIQAGNHPVSGTDPKIINAGVKILKDIIDRNSQTTTKLGQVQLYTLYAGVIFFLIWRILSMK